MTTAAEVLFGAIKNYNETWNNPPISYVDILLEDSTNGAGETISRTIEINRCKRDPEVPFSTDYYTITERSKIMQN